MFTLNDKRINIYAPFTDEDGVTYPNLRDPALRDKLGVLEVPDPVWPEPADEYYVTENEDGSLNITPKSPEQIAQQNQAKTNAASLAYLAETDWYVTRHAENGTPIPIDVVTKRQAARDAIVKLPEVV